MSKKGIAAIIILILIVVGWYLFRPERLFISKRVNEEFPDTQSAENVKTEEAPQLTYRGSFHGVAHETRGIASVYRLPEGRNVLRLTDFETSNGPDVQVYLVAADDSNDSETVTKAGFVHIGPLKGNIGDQNYDLPTDLDLNKFRSVTIWCRRFSVNFGTAPLSAETEETSTVSKPVEIYEGNFHGVAHEGAGLATIYQLPNGKRVLRFTNFQTSNGPDVQVYLVAADDSNDSETVTNVGFVHIGPLKGNIGDQNYDLPTDLDLNKFRSVTIWCRRFGVNFATAPLSPSRNEGA
jgi:hypothetical protein